MTTLKIVRKGQNTVIKAVQAIITSNGVTSKELMEKLHHPDLRPRVEDALKDFKLCLEEGDDVCVSRVIGQTCNRDQMDDFDISVSKLLEFLYTITIPAKEEANGLAKVVEPATDEEMEFVKSWLEDLKNDKLLCVSYMSFWKEGMAPGRISGDLMKKLLTAFIQIYGQ